MENKTTPDCSSDSFWIRALADFVWKTAAVALNTLESEEFINSKMDLVLSYYLSGFVKPENTVGMWEQTKVKKISTK